MYFMKMMKDWGKIYCFVEEIALLLFGFVCLGIPENNKNFSLTLRIADNSSEKHKK